MCAVSAQHARATPRRFGRFPNPNMDGLVVWRSGGHQYPPLVEIGDA